MFGKTPTAKAATAPGFDELLNRKRSLDLEIASRQDQEIDGLKAKVNAVADALGISVAELFGIKTGQPERRKKRKTIAIIKYRDPAQPENTWSGNGKTPKWLLEKIDKAARMQEFEVA